MPPPARADGTSGTLRLSLFCTFQVFGAGGQIPVAPASQRLVSFLALRNTAIRRSFAAGSLWLGADERRAAASLRSALWRLAPLDLVHADATHLRLNPEIEVDLHRVTAETVAVLGDATPDDRLLPLARELLRIGDDILLGWYDDWVVMERERFRQLRLHALDRIGERLLESGRVYEALRVGLAATHSEPLRESAQRLLVRVHLAEGNVAEAIRQYRTYADLLRAELGARPSRSFDALLLPYLTPERLYRGRRRPPERG